MSRGFRFRAFLFVWVFGVFLATILLVNFFHTEKSPFPSSSCPACHLQQTSLATGVALVLYVPQLLLLEILPIPECSIEISALAIDLVTRSPPTS